MSATATKTRKIISPEASISRLQRQLADKAAADWRRWSVAVADNGEFPEVTDLLSAASALGITDPVSAIRDDAQAITDARSAVRNASNCEQAAADMLAPFDGNPDAILAAIENAKAEIARLQAIFQNACDQCGASYARSVLHRVRMTHPRLWPDYEGTGKADLL